jgi:hypothetical protein
MITKFLEKNGVGCYEVSTKDCGGAHFYISIDKKNGLINFYTSRDMSIPVEIVDCANKDKPLKGIPGVPGSIFGRVVIKALRVFDVDGFPDCISYAA